MVDTLTLLTFDCWRAAYDDLTDEEQSDYARHLGREYPDQDRADLLQCERFFQTIPTVAHVLEIGGWNGRLAAHILNTVPGLRNWTNIDPNADQEHQTADPRYLAIVPAFFYWWRYGNYRGYDTLVASHVLEHFKQRDIHELLAALPDVQAAYVECPITQTGGNDWAGYDGTHILECGWDGLTEVFEDHGFQDRGTHTGDSRSYRRSHPHHPGAG